MAWNTRLAGWPRRRTAAGTDEATTWASSAVVPIGRAAAIARAIRRANRPSPLARNHSASSSASVSLTTAKALEASPWSIRMSSGASWR